MIDKAGEIGLEACKEKAEKTTAFSTEDAQTAILQKLQQGPATGEVLVWHCKDQGIVPHDDRAFGGAFLGLSRRGLIRKVGSGKRYRGHGTAGAIIWAINAEI